MYGQQKAVLREAQRGGYGGGGTKDPEEGSLVKYDSKHYPPLWASLIVDSVQSRSHGSLVWAPNLDPNIYPIYIIYQLGAHRTGSTRIKGAHNKGVAAGCYEEPGGADLILPEALR